MDLGRFHSSFQKGSAHCQIFPLDKPTAIGSAHILGTPSLYCAKHRHPAGDVELRQRIRSRDLHPQSVKRRAAFDVSPHVRKLDGLGCKRDVIHLLHNFSSIVRTPPKADSCCCFYLGKPRNRQKGVSAPDCEPKIDLFIRCHGLLSWADDPRVRFAPKTNQPSPRTSSDTRSAPVRSLNTTVGPNTTAKHSRSQMAMKIRRVQSKMT